MARGRMISTEIAEDEEFNEMSIDSQFMFIRTIPHLDRDGLIAGNPILLHAKVAPLLQQYGTKMESIINEWINSGFVIRYSDGKKDVLFFKNFSKHQNGMRYDREAVSQFSPPPGYVRTEDGLVALSDESAPVDKKTLPDSNSGNSPADIRSLADEFHVEVEVEVEDKVEDKEKTSQSPIGVVLPEPVTEVILSNPQQQTAILEQKPEPKAKVTKTPAEKKQADARVKQVIDAFVKARGSSKGINYAQEGMFAKKIVTDYGTDDYESLVIETFQWLKKDDFWKNKPLGLATIFKNIEAYQRYKNRGGSAVNGSSSGVLKLSQPAIEWDESKFKDINF